MDREKVPDQKADALMKKLRTVWDIKNHYWYPLQPDCRRKDINCF